MIKNLLPLLIGFLSVFLASCSSFDDSSLSGTSDETVHAMPNAAVYTADNTNDTILSFESENAFRTAITTLAQLESDSVRTEWVKAQYPSFKSIRDIYNAAGEEAATASLQTEVEFKSFQTKYNKLYFPLIEEDAGFYIPIKDEATAFLANANCCVRIAGIVTDLRNINDYSDLMETGKAYYSLETPMLLAAEDIVPITGCDVNSVGDEYTSGWTEYKSRKIMLKARRRFEKLMMTIDVPGIKSLIHTELCFRKKTWLGWMNYSGKSTMTGIIRFVNSDDFMVLDHNENGMSSHDNEIPYPVMTDRTHLTGIYGFDAVSTKVKVTLDGISDIMEYTITLPKITVKANFPYDIYPKLRPKGTDLTFPW